MTLINISIFFLALVILILSIQLIRKIHYVYSIGSKILHKKQYAVVIVGLYSNKNFQKVDVYNFVDRTEALEFYYKSSKGSNEFCLVRLEEYHTIAENKSFFH